MSKNIYYHNPRCSKSRQGLALLETREVSIEIKEYLKEGFEKTELEQLFTALDMNPEDVIRKKDDLYKELVSDPQSLNREQWIDLIVKHPALMERPILVTAKGTKIGRPPEALLEIL